MEQVIKIKLLGETFKFKSDQNRNNIKEILAYLVEELQRVEKQFPPHALKTHKLPILVMTALNISKQYVELTNDHSKLLQSVMSRTSQLDEMIDQQ